MAAERTSEWDITQAMETLELAAEGEDFPAMLNELRGLEAWLLAGGFNELDSDASTVRRLVDVAMNLIARTTSAGDIQDEQREETRSLSWIMFRALVIRAFPFFLETDILKAVRFLEQNLTLEDRGLEHYRDVVNAVVVFQTYVKTQSLIYNSSIPSSLVRIVDMFTDRLICLGILGRLLQFKNMPEFAERLKSYGILDRSRRLLTRSFEQDDKLVLVKCTQLLCHVFKDDEKFLVDLARDRYGPIREALKMELELDAYDNNIIWWIIATLCEPDEAKPYMIVFLPYVIETQTGGPWGSCLNTLETLHALGQIPQARVDLLRNRPELLRLCDYNITRFGHSSLETVQLTLALRVLLISFGEVPPEFEMPTTSNVVMSEVD